MSMVSKRILKEIERLNKDPVPGIIAKPNDGNIRYFEVFMDGPSQSPYEGKQRFIFIANSSICVY